MSTVPSIVDSPVRVVGDSGSVSVELAGVVDVSCAATLRDALAGLADGSRITVDCSGMERFDSGILQVLAAAVRHFADSGGTLAVRGLNEEASGYVALAGFGGLIGCAESGAAHRN